MQQTGIREYCDDFPSSSYFENWREEHAQPIVFRQLVSNWDIVKAGLSSDFLDLKSYILEFADANAQTALFAAPKHQSGRFGYGKNVREFNFESHYRSVPRILDSIEQSLGGVSDFNVYAGSMPVGRYFPNLAEETRLPFVLPGATQSLWLGTRSRIATHFDASQNIACVISGKRRFTLFPPSQTPRMYLGPLDFTPAGQCISLVDPVEPDFDKFPLFEDALNFKVTVDLEPGDAIYIPAMWWHHVECKTNFGGLINFWWESVPKSGVSQITALIAAFLAIEDLPDPDRAAWGEMFNYFVFRPDGTNSNHLSNHEKGVFGERNSANTKSLVAFLRKALGEKSIVIKE